jgi:hypothetical protein
MSELDKWDSFYVIVGSAAGALIGLQFVVIDFHSRETATARVRSRCCIRHTNDRLFQHNSADVGSTAGPMAIDQPCCALVGLVGVTGIAYAIIVGRRMRVQTTYRPEFEDWVFHLLLPLGAYVMLTVSALASAS